MKLTYRAFEVHKRVPLAISRGTQSSSVNWEVHVTEDGITGIGEAAEFSIPATHQPSDFLGIELERTVAMVRPFHPWQRHEAETALVQAGVASSVRAAIDMALYDWAGKAVHQPVWRMLGLPMRGTHPTSVTIGIATPERAQRRWVQWLEIGVVRSVKLKLGSPEGIEADRAMFEAVLRLLPPTVRIAVDANGGWSVEDALTMCDWLSERRVEHVEQPVAPIDLNGLRAVHQRSPIPVMADEACRNSQDLRDLQGACSGINIKLLKCGGMSEALRMIPAARALGLSVMLGCYSQTVLGNTAANQLARLVDIVDLDSHLNLRNDPFVGCRFDDGYLVNRELPGLGVTHA
ncbi:MAG: dipeptide epimerase [Pirellula sp.]